MSLPTTARTSVPYRLLWAGIAWTCLIQFFAAQLVAQWASSAPYVVRQQNISDLGNTACGPYRYPTNGQLVDVCSPRHGLVNASFILSGLLLAAGAVLAWRYWPRRRAITVAKSLVVAGGIGWALAGLGPENETLLLHSLGSILLLVGGNVGLIMLGLATRRTAGLGVSGILTAVAGATGAIATVLFLTNQSLRLGPGTMERLAAYPFIVWAIAVGISWLTTARARPVKR